MTIQQTVERKRNQRIRRNLPRALLGMVVAIGLGFTLTAVSLAATGPSPDGMMASYELAD